MTLCQAQEILDNWKHNVRSYPQATINEALLATGDLVGPLDETYSVDENLGH